MTAQSVILSRAGLKLDASTPVPEETSIGSSGAVSTTSPEPSALSTAMSQESQRATAQRFRTATGMRRLTGRDMSRLCGAELIRLE